MGLSFGECFKARGWKVVSIDFLPASKSTIMADLFTFDYTMLDGTFDVVWASPPCRQYSIARSKAKTPRNLEGADALVRRALEIIERVRPRAVFPEDPAGGLLRTRDVVRGLRRFDLDDFQFGVPYRKITRIWTNVEFQAPRLCKQDCWACEGGRHKGWVQTAAKERGGAGLNTSELGRIPRLVCEEI